MQSANPLPVSRIRLEERGRSRCACLPDRVEALRVGLKYARTFGLGQFCKVPVELPGGPGFGRSEKDPASLLEALQKARFAEDLQVARHAWLTLSQNLGELADGQLGVLQQFENAKPRRIAGSAQPHQQTVQNALRL